MTRVEGRDTSFVVELPHHTYARYVSKAAAVAALEACGLEAPTAQWLAMTTAKGDRGVRFSYDVPAVRALYENYLETDLEPAARDLAAAGRLGVVIAPGRADMLPRRASRDVFTQAGRADAVPRDLGLVSSGVAASARVEGGCEDSPLDARR